MKISKREWSAALLVALATVALTLIPYGLGYLTARDGWVFTGLLMNPEDSQTYFAKMLQGYDGHWLYTIPFTPEPHQGAFVGVFYIGLGHLARELRISLEAIWQLARITADLILFLGTFAFVAAFLPDRKARWTAYLLSLYGSGLGWLLFLLNRPYWLGAFPVDFKQPGAHLFFSALTFPHVALGTALTMFAVWLLLRASPGRGSPKDPWATAVVAGYVNAALGIIYPFLIYLIAVVAALFWIYLVWQRRRFLWRMALIYGLMFAIPAPLFLYYAHALGTNAAFRAWDAQSLTPALPWPHYLLAYGIMFLLGIIHWRREPNARAPFALLWLWILGVALLLYAPIGPQRRYVQGVQVPLAILSAVAFHRVCLPWLRRTRAWRALVARPRYSDRGLTRLAMVLFLGFMSISNIYILASVSTSAVVQQPDTLFRPVAEVEMTAWLRENEAEKAIILSDYLTGNYVAAHSGRRVFVGHWAETMDYERKMADVDWFFATQTSDDWRRQLLAGYQITHIWFGPRERALGDFDPSASDFLEPVHSYQDVTLYAVTP